MKADDAGAFTLSNTIDIQGEMPMSLWGDDINGDGTIDLATANAMSGTLSSFEVKTAALPRSRPSRRAAAAARSGAAI